MTLHMHLCTHATMHTHTNTHDWGLFLLVFYFFFCYIDRDSAEQ